MFDCKIVIVGLELDFQVQKAFEFSVKIMQCEVFNPKAAEKMAFLDCNAVYSYYITFVITTIPLIILNLLFFIHKNDKSSEYSIFLAMPFYACYNIYSKATPITVILKRTVSFR